jgi:hypothetical protein
MYHSWIYPLNPFPLFPLPHSWSSFSRSHFSIFIHEYIIFPFHSASLYHPFLISSPLSLGPTPRSVIYHTVLPSLCLNEMIQKKHKYLTHCKYSIKTIFRGTFSCPWKIFRSLKSQKYIYNNVKTLLASFTFILSWVCNEF